MPERWYKEAVIYCVEVDAFQDSDGDGCGDLRGLTSRLDYLARLGVTCLWLNPIHPSPQRDNGYDISDYYGIDPRIGTLGDFTELAVQARERGIRLLLDLVVNHTSDQHPWFRLGPQRSRLRRIATGTCGATPNRPTADRASCSLASKRRRGPSTRSRSGGTSTASTTSSLI